MPEGKHRKIKVLMKLWVGQRHVVSCADRENGEVPCQNGLLWFNPSQQPSPMQLLTQSSTSRTGERIIRIKAKELMG